MPPPSPRHRPPITDRLGPIPISGGGPIPGSRRFLVLINQKSRRGKADIDAARERLGQAARLVEIDCADAAAMDRAIRDHVGHVDAVIIGGGDGTVNAAAVALADTGLPLGLLPLGTANDLARTLNIPTDMDAAVAVILTGRTRRIDLGVVNGRGFFNVAGLGFSVALARSLTPDLKRRWGRFGYGLVALRLLWRMRPLTATLVREGETEKVRAIQIAVANGRYFGGGLDTGPGTRIDDGMFEILVLRLSSWGDGWALLRRLVGGTAGFRRWRCDRLEIRTRHRHWVNTDGELTVRTPATFTLRPGAVTVFVPETVDEGMRVRGR